MLREDIAHRLTEALKAKESTAVSTLRLINAAIKDRDIAARGKGTLDGISDDEILSLLQSMIKQRRESIKMYEEGGRDDLVKQESREIEVIQSFLPEPLSDAEMDAAIDAVISGCGADCIKDMGSVMGQLKAQFAGRMDFGKASGLVKKKLA